MASAGRLSHTLAALRLDSALSSSVAASPTAEHPPLPSLRQDLVDAPASGIRDLMVRFNSLLNPFLRTMTSQKLKMMAETEQGASTSVGLQWDLSIGIAHSKLCLKKEVYSCSLNYSCRRWLSSSARRRPTLV
jgi:hypothetical protein